MIRRLCLCVVLAGCGPSGSRLEIWADHVQLGAADLEVTINGDGETAFRAVRLEDARPFVFQVLVPIEGPVDVHVEAIAYTPDPESVATFDSTATLADGTVARLAQDPFPPE